MAVPRKPMDELATPKMPEEPKYPTICFRDEHADKLVELLGGWPEVKEGIDFEQLHTVVCATENTEYCRRIELQLRGLSKAVGGETEGDDDTEEEKAPPAKKSIKKPVAPSAKEEE